MHAPCVQRTGKNNGTLSKKTGESWRVSRCNCWDRTHHTETSVLYVKIRGSISRSIERSIVNRRGWWRVEKWPRDKLVFVGAKLKEKRDKRKPITNNSKSFLWLIFDRPVFVVSDLSKKLFHPITLLLHEFSRFSIILLYLEIIWLIW